MGHEREFIFTITPGHSDAAWLAQLLKTSLPQTKVHHVRETSCPRFQVPADGQRLRPKGIETGHCTSLAAI